jgi:hypothetical protein
MTEVANFLASKPGPRQVPDDPLRHLAIRALALLVDDSEVAWSALPTSTDALRIEYVVGNNTTRLHSLPVRPGAGLTGKVYLLRSERPSVPGIDA